MAKILAIDDSEAFRIQIKEVLGKYNVIEAVDGIDAFEKLKLHPDVDLIVCDINMPNMDGVTFCQRKSEIKDLASIPVIMITTESNSEIKKQVKNYGVKAWILKPIDARSLSLGVDHLLKK